MIKRVLPVFILFLLCLPFEARAEEVLTWQNCVREAAKNHPDLISSIEGINQEKAAKAVTASGLYPQITGTAGVSTAKTSSSSGSDDYSYGASASQLVFDGFKTANEVKSASENIQAAKESYRFTSSQVRLNLRTAFINLLKAQELIQVTEDITKIRRDNLVLITLRYESGLEHKGALLKAEADVAQASFEASQAKRDVELSQRQLTKEMGRKEFKPMYVKADFTVSDSAKEKPSFEEIVKTNPSVLQTVAKKNSAAYGIKSAYANFAPEVSGAAGASKSSASWPPENEQWNLGLSLNLPIFEGGLRFAQVNQAKAAYNQAVANERSTKDTAIVSLEQTWVSLQDAIETVVVQLKTLEAAQERSKIAEAQYSVGFITFDNWIIIEDELVRAKINYLNAQANAVLAEANWIQAKGETLEYAQ